MDIHEIKFCTYCGSQELHMFPNGYKCNDCSRYVFDNQAAVTGVVLRLPDGRILLAERGRDPHKGKHDFPGGFADRDENLEDACVREIREELGVDIDRSQLTYLCSGHVRYEFAGTTAYLTDVHFLIDITDELFAQMQAADDVARIVPMQPADITRDMMAWDTGWEVVEKVREM